MAKKKTMFVCQQCGYDAPKWLGRCPGCGQWNTMAEEVIQQEKDSRQQGLNLGLSDKSRPVPITQVRVEDLPRITSGSGELDRVLGGGIIPDRKSVV